MLSKKADIIRILIELVSYHSVITPPSIVLFEDVRRGERKTSKKAQKYII